ncbi:unnamed protein product [Auanema sp. JU1783]|nr:unnamed protein product [Auanema sp. JU1783]
MKILAFLFLSLVTCSAHKILFFNPTLSRSHMISNGRIADELVQAGHEVVLFEPDFLFIVKNLNISKYARRWAVHNFTSTYLDSLNSFTRIDILGDGDWHSDTSIVYKYGSSFNIMCRDLINNDEIMGQLRKEKFDAYFGEQVSLCGNALAYALGIKIHFWVTSCPMAEGQTWAIGLPVPLSYVPAGINLDMDLHPSYFKRAQNIVFSSLLWYFTRLVNIELTSIFQDKFGQDFPDVEDIAKNSDIIFVSTDEFVELPRPTLPNIVHIGGLGATDSVSEMGEKFEKEMNKGKKGVVLFSLGTIVNTTDLPKIAMNAVFETSQHFSDYHFLVRVDKSDKYARELAATSDNFAVFDWLPQPAILLHPRLRAFITHAGYNGIMEAARAGTPLITIPFMFDQTRNSRAVEMSGWGVIVRRQTLRQGPVHLIAGLQKVLGSQKYKQAAMRIRNLVRNKPFNASQRLIQYTNFVLANGGMKELLVEGRNLTTSEVEDVKNKNEEPKVMNGDELTKYIERLKIKNEDASQEALNPSDKEGEEKILTKQEEVLAQFLVVDEKLTMMDYVREFFEIRGAQDALRSESKYASNTACNALYFSRNRYRDILPYDYNRVVLSGTESNPDGYMNASHISLDKGKTKFIAAQAPLPTTLEEWWQMIDEQNVSIILMLCKLLEMNKVKCQCYWPKPKGTKEIFGNYEVTFEDCERFDDDEDYILRVFSFENQITGVKKTVKQLHYKEWPDHGCPSGEIQLLNMIKKMADLQTNIEQPVLVHCSAGVGRTGTIIAVNYVRELIEQNALDSLNIFEIVLSLRKQRASMVQTQDQYHFLHKCIARYCREQLGIPEPFKPIKCEPAQAYVTYPPKVLDESYESDSDLDVPDFPDEPPAPRGPEELGSAAS